MEPLNLSLCVLSFSLGNYFYFQNWAELNWGEERGMKSLLVDDIYWMSSTFLVYGIIFENQYKKSNFVCEFYVCNGLGCDSWGNWNVISRIYIKKSTKLNLPTLLSIGNISK